MEGPYEKTKKTMEKIYREAEPNQDLNILKSYTSAPWTEVALKLKATQRNRFSQYNFQCYKFCHQHRKVFTKFKSPTQLEFQYCNSSCNRSQLMNHDISGAILTLSVRILILNSQCVEGAKYVRVPLLTPIIWHFFTFY